MKQVIGVFGSLERQAADDFAAANNAKVFVQSEVPQPLLSAVSDDVMARFLAQPSDKVGLTITYFVCA